VGRVEEPGRRLGGDLLERVGRVEGAVARRGVPDAERACAEGVEVGEAAGDRVEPVRRRHVETAERVVGEEPGKVARQAVDAVAVGERVGADRAGPLGLEVLDPQHLAVAVVIAGVALVRGDEVGRAVHVVRVDGVGHRQPEQRPGADVHGPVAVGHVERRHPVVDGAEAADRGDGRAGEIDLGDRVRLLQAHPRGAGIRRHGRVLRLEVLGDGERGDSGSRILAATEDADVGREGLRAVGLERAEVGGAHVRLLRKCHGRREGDDADPALGVDGVVLGGLPLVRDDESGAVGRERDRVGESADGDGPERLTGPGGIEEHDPADVGLRVGFDGDGTQAVGADGHGVHGDAGGDRGSVTGDDPDRLHLEELGGRGGVGQREHVDLRRRCVDHEESLGRRIVGDDLRGALVEGAGLEGAEGAQLECGVLGGQGDRVRDDIGQGGTGRGEGQQAASDDGRGSGAEEGGEQGHGGVLGIAGEMRTVEPYESSVAIA